jgi:hypothetical protein
MAACVTHKDVEREKWFRDIEVLFVYESVGERGGGRRKGKV